MKTRTIILVGIIAILFVGTAILVQAREGSAAPGYTVEAGVIAGDGYSLTSLEWRVNGSTGGSGYHLLSPAVPSQAGGCCCLYLPCVQKNFP